MLQNLLYHLFDVQANLASRRAYIQLSTIKTRRIRTFRIRFSDIISYAEHNVYNGRGRSQSETWYDLYYFPVKETVSSMSGCVFACIAPNSGLVIPALAGEGGKY